jgi:hypothetical protein
MVHWEICCRQTEKGFTCELPEGMYYIGDPNEMLLPGILSTIGNLNSGTFQDVESDAIIVLHPFWAYKYTLDNGTTIETADGVIALMSADIVKPAPAFEEQQIFFDQRVVVTVDVEDATIMMRTGDTNLVLNPCEEIDYEETDEDMYTRLYAGQGVKY